MEESFRYISYPSFRALNKEIRILGVKPLFFVLWIIVCLLSFLATANIIIPIILFVLGMVVMGFMKKKHKDNDLNFISNFIAFQSQPKKIEDKERILQYLISKHD